MERIANTICCELSVIIPVLNEQANINSIIEHLYERGIEKYGEIVVVDGDQQKGTLKSIKHKRIVKISSEKSRAGQMNAGAKAAKGKILLFLHSDTKLPDKAFEMILKIMKNNKYTAGAFDLQIDSDRWIYKYISWQASKRSRITRIPYGDQAIFICKDYFDQLGGYKNIPIMEDVDLMRRIKKDKRKIHILKDKVLTSARRWEKEGMIFTTLRNQILVTLFYLGVSPKRLVRYYKTHIKSQKHKQKLLVFVKAPVVGKVKTRLGSEIGMKNARELYKCFVNDTLAKLNLPPDIYFSGTWKEQHIKQWLGDSYNFHAQNGEDLGEKMRNAFIESFERSSQVLIIGSDSPDMPAEYITDAFNSLDGYDCVLGPSSDGGYYLIGFNRKGFLSEVFDNIDWSSERVLVQTKEVLYKYKKKVKILPMWHDIDTVEDLRKLEERNERSSSVESETMRYLQNISLRSIANG